MRQDAIKKEKMSSKSGMSDDAPLVSTKSDEVVSSKSDVEDEVMSPILNPQPYTLNPKP